MDKLPNKIITEIGNTEYFPENLSEAIEYKPVVAILMTRDAVSGGKEVLLTKSRKTGKWYYPGGKMDMQLDTDGTYKIEDPKLALRREFKEELGVELSVDIPRNPTYTEPVKTEGNFYLVYTYAVDVTDKDLGEFTLQEGDTVEEFQWVTSPFDYDLTEVAKNSLIESGLFGKPDSVE